MNYLSNKPYPEPQVERKNLEYAKLLLEDYAGRDGEDTAIHQYLYQHLLKDNELSDFALAMEHIAEVEMYHLSLLGKTIRLLGFHPVFGEYSSNKNFIFWNSSSVNYTNDLSEMILSDIKKEEDAIRRYKYHRSIIQDHYIKSLLTRIIEDEEIHLTIFYSFYKQYCK